MQTRNARRTARSGPNVPLPSPLVGPAAAPRGQARTVNESVYRQLKADILQGELEPGMRLRFEALRGRYAAGIGSLREALSRLIAEGLVEVESHKGARVADMHEADLLDLVQLRKNIESQVLARSIAHGDDHWEAQVLAAYHFYERLLKGPKNRLSRDERTARHNAFHNALVGACDSPRLLWLRTILYSQAERYLALAFKNTAAEDDAVLSEHSRIMKAALDRDAKTACSLIEQHLESAARGVLPIVRKLERSSRARR